jgi:opacity protein-like surface antigen
VARLSSLFLLSAALAAGPAIAADLLPPPPSLEGYGQPVELGTGWYLRGDIGYTDYTPPRDRFFGTPSLPALVGERLEHTFSVGGGIGYQVNEWFRADATVDYRNRAEFTGIRPLSASGLAYVRDDGELDSVSFMLNGYVDLGTWSGITPYLGAGIGLASNRLNDVRRYTYVGGAIDSLATVETKTTNNLAWALMGGVSAKVGSGFAVDLGYRYIHLGDVRTRWDSAAGIKTDALQAHEVRLGARYMID